MSTPESLADAAGPLEIRTMRESDVALALDWAAAEGWNPGLSDAALFRAVDPDGFFVALEAGEPVGVISVVRYAPSFAFLGFYMVRPDRRGRGIGDALRSAALAGRPADTIGLDGVVEQQESYRRSGFEPAHRNIRYSGEAAVLDGPVSGVRMVEAGDFAALAGMDAAAFGTERPSFLAGWLQAPGHVAMVAAEADGRLSGYGVLRPCRTGFKIAPLFAETPEAAGRLLAALIAKADIGAIVMIDVPEPNAAARTLAEAAGLLPVFETARMYRGPAPDLPLDRIFGLTSFELG
jgi:predicted N-acetyltransferase YhbS